MTWMRKMMDQRLPQKVSQKLIVLLPQPLGKVREGQLKRWQKSQRKQVIEKERKEVKH